MIPAINEFETDRNSPSFIVKSLKEVQNLAPIDVQIPPPLVSPAETLDLDETGVRVSEPDEMHGLVTGDMVWGKVKSHPWWPGHIFNEAFALPSVRRTKRDGFVLVAFFGDSSYGWFDPAELIPYGPTFLEKSKQTTSKSFVNAVEESVDEISRRAAVGISCRCRNSHNFRPTKVLDYFEVDVVGYDKNGIYSKSQIQKERENFDPMGVLSFLQNLAVTMRGSDTKDVEWHRNVGMVLAWRSVKFEELDGTYAQAFGQLLVMPAEDEQAESSTPRVAALSGPLRIADTLNDTSKSAVSKHFSSSSSPAAPYVRVKRNKYVLKRRDERKDATITSSDHPPSLPDSYFPQKQPTLILNDSNAESSAFDNEYVLQKRERVERDIKHEYDFDDGDVKESKIQKKRRKKEGEAGPVYEYSDASVLGQLEIPNLVSDLLELALNPFHGVERKTPSIVCRAFLRFRSLVYSKSLALPTSSAATGGGRIVVPSHDEPKPTKLVKGSDVEPTKVAKQRAPSDRQEEMAAMRMKKLSQVKLMTRKTLGGGPKVPENEATIAGTAGLAKKPVLPSPPKGESPAFLIMKFPPRSALPSVSNLKARFARFGPLEVDGTQVLWKTHSCIVQFKCKPDASRALQFVRSNDIFGQVQVEYGIREAGTSDVDGSSLAVGSWPSGLKSILKRPGGDIGGRKESQRVKFMLSGNASNDGKAADSPPAADVAPPRTVPSKATSPQPQPPLPPPARFHGQPRPLPPPPLVELSSAEKRAPPAQLGVDISHEMLSLLLRCNDVVSELKSLPGFAPYRAL